eukprot:m.465683 g.465683  ORF g.465683 m.465683 type:complete len:353 (-) comp57051_c0_seq1:1980-3038(-)
MFEIWTKAALPYLAMSNQKVWVSVIGGYRLPQPDDCPQVIYELMLQCWNRDPHERPAFSLLHDRLRAWSSSSGSGVERKASQQSTASNHHYLDFTKGSDVAPPVRPSVGFQSTLTAGHRDGIMNRLTSAQSAPADFGRKESLLPESTHGVQYPTTSKDAGRASIESPYAGDQATYLQPQALPGAASPPAVMVPVTSANSGPNHSPPVPARHVPVPFGRLNTVFTMPASSQESVPLSDAEGSDVTDVATAEPKYERASCIATLSESMLQPMLLDVSTSQSVSRSSSTGPPLAAGNSAYITIEGGENLFAPPRSVSDFLPPSEPSLDFHFPGILARPSDSGAILPAKDEITYGF